MVELSSHVLTSNRTLLAEEIECYREKSTEIEEGENFQSKIEFVVVHMSTKHSMMKHHVYVDTFVLFCFVLVWII
jgi:hypothetical protein